MRVHFISIGGSIMHQLAISLHKKGYVVTGSDDEIFEPAKGNLLQYQLLPEKLGWDETKITPDLDAILLGMHARADNPELVMAQQLNLPIFSFPEYIYHESKDKIRVVIGGSHGKTTTTAMIMHVLQQAQKTFDYLVGAKLPGFEQSVQLSSAPVLICEGDEYPASALNKVPKFHFLYPQIAILTGIAWDHINVFPTFDFYLEQFSIFISKIEPGGVLIYNQTDKVLTDLVNHTATNHVRLLPYKLPPFIRENDKTIITLGDTKTELAVFGDHNLLNLQAARLACEQLGLSLATFCESISNFTGAAKRLERLNRHADRIVFRDFAHAPSKVKATVDAVKSQFPNKKVAAVLELHTYSSLNKEFMPFYQGTLDAADKACVFYSPHAMEIKKMPPLPPEVVSEGFQHIQLDVLQNRSDLETWIEKRRLDCDHLLLMSSGSYDGLALELVTEKW